MKSKGQPRKKVVKAAQGKTKNIVTKKNTVTRKSAQPHKKIVSREQPSPEVIKQESEVQPSPPNKEMLPDISTEHKILENEFENREQAIMNKENQKVKSAMANQKGIRGVFRTRRHP